MSRQRFTSTTTFAWQFLLACLRDEQVPPELRGVILFAEETKKSRGVYVHMIVRILGAPCDLDFECDLRFGGEHHHVTQGTATLRLVTDPDYQWKFSAMVGANNQLWARLTERGYQAVLARQLREFLVSEEQPNIAERTRNCLARAQKNTVDDLVRMSEDDLMEITNFGQKCLDFVVKRLAEHNLYLRGWQTDHPSS